MAEIQIVRRNKNHELQITVTDQEAEHLFGDRDPAHWFVKADGDPSGFTIRAVDTYDGFATRTVRPLAKSTKNKVFAARWWMPKSFGTVQAFREEIPAKPKLTPGGLEFRGLPVNWIDENTIAHRKEVERAREEEAERRRRDEAEPGADEERRPLPDALAQFNPKALDQDDTVVAERPVEVDDAGPISTLDRSVRRRAFEEALRLTALLNVEIKKAGSMMEVAVKDYGKWQRVVIKRVYLVGPGK